MPGQCINDACGDASVPLRHSPQDVLLNVVIFRGSFNDLDIIMKVCNGVSMWLTTQSYNRIPLMIRKVTHGFSASKMKNVKEILSINDEFVMGLSKEQFMDILKYAFFALYDESIYSI
eukprot:SAG31_NODE_4412_length_3253_cov_1.928028_2_plen_118_part_00